MLDTQLTPLVPDQTQLAHAPADHHWNISLPCPADSSQPQQQQQQQSQYGSCDDSDAATHADEDLVLNTTTDDAVSRFIELPPLDVSKPIRTCSSSAFAPCGGLGQPPCAPFDPAQSKAPLFAAVGIPLPQPPSECVVPTPHHAVPIYPSALHQQSHPSLHIGFSRDLALPNYSMAALLNAGAPPTMLVPIIPTPPPLQPLSLPLATATTIKATPRVASTTTAAASVTATSNEVESDSGEADGGDEDYNDAEEEEEAAAHSRPSGGSRRKRARGSSSGHGGGGGDHTREAHVMTDRQRRAKIKSGMDQLKLILRQQGMLAGSSADQATVTLHSVKLLDSMRRELDAMHQAFDAALHELQSAGSLLERAHQPQLAAAVTARALALAQQRQHTVVEATQSRLGCGGGGGGTGACGGKPQTGPVNKAHNHSSAAAAVTYPYAPLTMELH